MIGRAVLTLTLLALVVTVEIFSQPPDDRDMKGSPPDVLEEFDETYRAATGQGYAPGRLWPSSGAEPASRLVPGLDRLVECYACTDCPNAQMNTTTKMCPFTADSSKNNRCVVYVEKYKHMKRSWYIRGCASERGSCAEISKAHSSHSDIVNLDFCQECEGDRCNVNAVSRSLPSLTAFFVLVVVPVLAKHTLS